MDPVALEELKTQSKKLSARATSLKMALHDLAGELSTGWEKIPEVAAAFEACKSSTNYARELLSLPEKECGHGYRHDQFA